DVVVIELFERLHFDVGDLQTDDVRCASRGGGQQIDRRISARCHVRFGFVSADEIRKVRDWRRGVFALERGRLWRRRPGTVIEMQAIAEAQDSYKPSSGDTLREVVVLQTGVLETSRLRSVLIPPLHMIAIGRHETDAEKRLRRVVVKVSSDACKRLNRRDDSR